MIELKNRILKHSIIGLLCGSFAYLVFATILSLRLNTGKFYFVLPALANNFGSEMFSVLLQIGAFLWLGIFCGIAYEISNNVEYLFKKQAIGYFLALSIGLLPVAFLGHWCEHIFIGIFSYLLLMMGISLILFIISWLRLKSDVTKIKKAIELKRRNYNE